MRLRPIALCVASCCLTACTSAPAQTPSAGSELVIAAGPAIETGLLGYYREPAIHRETVIFCAEGDLWRCSINGGMATRLTTAAGEETSPAISPDGHWVAFAAGYEGPNEIYVMPVSGGLPKRLTWDARPSATVCGWAGTRIIAATDRFSTLPAWQLTLIDPATGARELVPLAQAADGVYDDGLDTLFFTRLQFQGSHSKRYRGGTAQNLWRFSADQPEAVPLTGDYAGTSASPMWFDGRVYFISDRGPQGTMEVWSMRPDGHDLTQHTEHSTFDVKSPSLHDGRIVFQRGADLRLWDVRENHERTIDVVLSSDFDQMRERWVTNPRTWISSSHLSHDGQRIALTARGRVFVAPRGQGRLVEITPASTARHRNARFMPDGQSLISLSDETHGESVGEVELWRLPSSGIGERSQLTSNGDVLRWEAISSPDGRWLAHHDKNLRLWLLNTDTHEQKQIDETNTDFEFGDLAWSPDSRWLAYVFTAENLNRQIKLYHIESGAVTLVTTDRYDSSSPAWSPDGRWLYLLSERHFATLVGSPWGRLQPEPFFDRKTKIYHVPLKSGARSPFAPADELHPDKPKDGPKEDTSPTSMPETQPAASQAASSQPDSAKSAIAPVEIELEGLRERMIEVPVPSGNYSNLVATDKRLMWLQRPPAGDESKPALVAADIARKDVKPAVIVKDIHSFEVSGDGRSLLIRRDGGNLFVIPADTKAGAALEEHAVDLGGWTFSLIPRDEWRQMFIEAWRLERDYFYDRKMVNVDWHAVLQRYLPLVDRVASRAELSDLIAQMVGELSTLHTFVRGGDLRTGESAAQPASLGAVLTRDEAAGGFRVDHVFRHDPDRPELAPPLSQPNVRVIVGEVITAINGRPALSVPDLSVLLRNQAGRQVLLSVKGVDDATRNVIAVPITTGAEADLRYHEWEFTRREIVERESDNDFGYVHIRAMGGNDFEDFAREFYPVYRRKGLIIDVRHNRGGNIDSWIISRLLRKAWFYWQPRIGVPEWNMQFAFRGHVVVLCNERTASDGEAFTEGVKRLKIGHTIGTRTWGGEVWLSSSNFLVDRGIATAAETGVYGPDGIWLIEGHGVEPDQVVDNLPHATFKGEDAQLTAAIEYLKRKVEEDPIEIPPAPPYPNLRWPR